MIPNYQGKMRWCQGVFAVILLLTYFAMAAAVLTAGNRGSDQFWYENEMGSLLAGTAPYTNCYFPGPIFRNETLVGSNYFIHHTAAHYLAWPASTIFGPFHGWVGTSILLTVLSAMLLADLAFRLTARKIWALATFGGYLLAPPVVWYSLNMLQESYFAFWITLSLYAVVRSARSVWWGFIAFGVLALGKLLHPFFPILFFVYVVTSTWILPCPFLHLLDFHLQDPRTSTVLAKYRPEYILIDNQIPNKQAVSDLYAFGIQAVLVKQGVIASLYQVSWMPLFKDVTAYTLTLKQKAL